MKKIIVIACCIFGISYALETGVLHKTTQATQPTLPRQLTPKPFNKYIIGYFPNWLLYPLPKRPKFTPSDIQANTLTHINYAFAKPYTTDSNRNITSYRISLTDSWADIQYKTNENVQKPYYGNFLQLYELKQKYPHIKTFISIGGWQIYQEGSPAPKFSTLAADPIKRKEFIDSCIEFCAQYDFNGIDLDWEFPGLASVGGKPEDKQHFTLLLRELYTAAKNIAGLKIAYNKFNKIAPYDGLLVTIAAPASSSMQDIEIDKIHQYLDWINLMTYDFFGPWSSITNHNAPLYAPAQGDNHLNVDFAVNYYIKQGVPASKLVLGMPLYGRSFAQATSTPDGLFSTFSGPGQGTAEQGVLSLGDIMQNYVSQYTRFWDNKAQVPYLYNNTTKQFISYDDYESLKNKSQWAKKNNLAGAMVWQLEKDQEIWQALKIIQDQLNQ